MNFKNKESEDSWKGEKKKNSNQKNNYNSKNNSSYNYSRSNNNSYHNKNTYNYRQNREIKKNRNFIQKKATNFIYVNKFKEDLHKKKEIEKSILSNSSNKKSNKSSRKPIKDSNSEISKRSEKMIIQKKIAIIKNEGLMGDIRIETRKVKNSSGKEITKNQNLKIALFDSQKNFQIKEKKKKSKEKYLHYKKGDNIKDHKKYFETLSKQKNYKKKNQIFNAENSPVIMINEESCEICYSKYTNNIKPAIFKNCGHTFCENCINEEQIENCPICKKKKDWVINLILENGYLKENDFLCLGCEFPFDEEFREPIILECGHTLCEICCRISFFDFKGKFTKCPIDEEKSILRNDGRVCNFLFRDFVVKKKKKNLEDIWHLKNNEILYCLTHYVGFDKNSGRHGESFHNTCSDRNLNKLFGNINSIEKKIESNYNQIFCKLGNINFSFPKEDIGNLRENLLNILYFNKNDIYKFEKKLDKKYRNLNSLIYNYDEEYISSNQTNTLYKFINSCHRIKKTQKEMEILFNNFKKLKNKKLENKKKVHYLPTYFYYLTQLNLKFNKLIKNFEFPIETCEFNNNIVQNISNIINESLKFFFNMEKKLMDFSKVIKKTINDVRSVCENFENFKKNLQSFKMKFDKNVKEKKFDKSMFFPMDLKFNKESEKEEKKIFENLKESFDNDNFDKEKNFNKKNQKNIQNNEFIIKEEKSEENKIFSQNDIFKSLNDNFIKVKNKNKIINKNKEDDENLENDSLKKIDNNFVFSLTFEKSKGWNNYTEIKQRRENFDIWNFKKNSDFSKFLNFINKKKK